MKNFLKTTSTAALVASGMTTAAFADQNNDVSQYYPMIDVVTALDAKSTTQPNKETHMGFHVIGDTGYNSKEDCIKNAPTITNEVKKDIQRVDGKEFKRYVSEMETCITGARYTHLKQIFSSAQTTTMSGFTMPYKVKGAKTGVVQHRPQQR